jgi:hypothetical protein
MSRIKLAIGVALLGVVMTVSAVAIAGGSKTKAKLSGFEEVPAVLTTGSGKVQLRINDSARTIDYALSYQDLEGGAVAAAHIHIGQRLANGGVSAFLCGGGGKPACPASPATVTGTIAAADVTPVQGVDDIDDLIRAIRLGITYANVHTEKHPTGEIRGQIGKKDDGNRY